MSEPKPEYLVEAEEMLGKGYEPAATIESPRLVRELAEGGLREYKAWGWVKISAKFIAHIKVLKGAKLSIWQTMALSIDENGDCSLSANEIAELTGYSRSEVIESQKELDEMGYLTVTKASGKKNIYKPEFAARGGSSPTTEPVQKNDQSRKTTSPVPLLASTPDQSSPSEGNSVPSINRVKRVNATKIKGIEAAMFQDRQVEESDLEKDEPALLAFERDMQLPASWDWYPAKQTKEREWRLLREFIVKTYAEDPKAFEKYNTWRNQPFVKGAKSNTQIKDYPMDFEVSWSDYLRANPQVKATTHIQEYIPEDESEFVPAPERKL